MELRKYILKTNTLKANVIVQDWFLFLESDVLLDLRVFQRIQALSLGDTHDEF